MAENKKSFIAYSDWNGMFKALPDEVAGKLIKHVFSYVNDENPKTDDYVINALFEQIKSTLKRDLKKWDKQREQRSLAGKRSAEIRATKSNERSTVVNEKERNATVSVSVSDSVNDNIITNTPNSIKDIEVVDYSYIKTFIQEIPTNKHDQWREVFYSNNKIKPNNLSKLLDRFEKHCIEYNKPKHKDIGKFKSHFSSWVKGEDMKGRLTDFKRR